MATAMQTTEATELPPCTRVEDIEGDFPMDDAVIRCKFGPDYVLHGNVPMIPS